MRNTSSWKKPAAPATAPYTTKTTDLKNGNFVCHFVPKSGGETAFPVGKFGPYSRAFFNPKGLLGKDVTAVIGLQQCSNGPIVASVAISRQGTKVHILDISGKNIHDITMLWTVLIRIGLNGCTEITFRTTIDSEEDCKHSHNLYEQRILDAVLTKLKIQPKLFNVNIETGMTESPLDTKVTLENLERKEKGYPIEVLIKLK
jgi:hypothetical protein